MPWLNLYIIIIINLILTYVLRSYIPQTFPFTEVTQDGAIGVAAAVHAEAEFGIAIATVTIPHPKITEETAVDLYERQKKGDVTHVSSAQVNSLINNLDFLRSVNHSYIPREGKASLVYSYFSQFDYEGGGGVVLEQYLGRSEPLRV